MLSFAPLTLLYLLASSLVSATPTKPLFVIREPQFKVINSRQLGNKSTTPCTPAQLALASGIASNIADQRNEVDAVSALGNILAEIPLNASLFAVAQSSLLSFVTTGIAIRQNNQKIAPPGNGAIAGLAIVAIAQMAELNLTLSLGLGVTNVTRANATINTLKADFAGGIAQNTKNLAAALGNCTVLASATSAAFATSTRVAASRF